jgi:tRNA-dihydrouridine synthase B
MGMPWIFRDALIAINGEEVPPAPSFMERVDIAVRQFELAALDRGEKVACLEARKHFAWYIKGMPYASFYKDKIMSVQTLEDIYNVSRDIKDTLRDAERSGIV